MTKFTAKLQDPCMVGGTHQHTGFLIFLKDRWVANGVNVETPDGRRLITIYDYDKDLKQELFEYYSSRKGNPEVTIKNPLR